MTGSCIDLAGREWAVLFFLSWASFWGSHASCLCGWQLGLNAWRSLWCASGKCVGSFALNSPPVENAMQKILTPLNCKWISFSFLQRGHNPIHLTLVMYCSIIIFQVKLNATLFLNYFLSLHPISKPDLIYLIILSSLSLIFLSLVKCDYRFCILLIFTPRALATAPCLTVAMIAVEVLHDVNKDHH